jgi:hypothetical protein
MNVRRALLTEATRLITDERNNQYGPPTQDFDRTAIMWTAYLDGRRILEAHDVAAMMIILKLSRISWDPTNRDSWVDIAGYSACGYECVTYKNKEEQQ